MKNTFFLIMLSGVIILFNGCVSSGGFPLNVHKDYTIKSDYKIIYKPSLNSITTVDVGQNMFSKYKLNFLNEYLVTLNGKAKGKGGSFIMGYVWVDSDNNSKTSGGNLGIKYYSKLRSLGNVKAMCYTNWICLTDLNSDGRFTNFSGFGKVNLGLLEQPVSYTTNQRKEFTEDSFKYQVLYQGKNHNNIKISFREFKDNLARPAFTQDIEYKLNKNGKTIIGFKGLRIEVLKATHLNITYKVIKDYNE